MHFQQRTHAEIVHAGVIADDGQTLGAGFQQRADQVLGNAAQAEAASRDGHVVEQQPIEGPGCAWVNLVHCRAFLQGESAAKDTTD